MRFRKLLCWLILSLWSPAVAAPPPSGLPPNAVDSLLRLAEVVAHRAPDSAEPYLRRAEALNAVGRYPARRQARLELTRGLLHHQRGRYDSSLYHYGRALRVATQRGQARGAADAHRGLGMGYYYLADMDSAVAHYTAALAHYDSAGLSAPAAKTLGNLGAVMSVTKEYPRAAHYLKRALHLLRAVGDSAGCLPLLVNLTHLHAETGRHDSALAYGEAALADSRALNHAFGIMKSLIMLSGVHVERGAYAEALRVARAAQQQADAVGNPTARASASLNEAQALSGLGRYAEAATVARRLLADTVRQTDLDHYLYDLLYQGAKATGRYADALAYHERYHASHEAFLDRAQQQTVADLEQRYQMAERNAEIVRLQQRDTIQALQLGQQRTYLWAGGALGVLLVALAVLVYRQRSLRARQQRQALQQRLLRVQLNPHFLYNALNAIQTMIYRQEDRTRTADYLAYFSQLTRKILELNQQEFITLEQEVDFIESYLKVQRIRFDHPFSYRVEVDEQIDQLECLLPPMITQPFVENAIEHGILTKGGDGHVRVCFGRRGDRLEVVVEDNGVGRQATFRQAVRPHRSLATRITRERLLHLERTFRRKADMQIQDLTPLGGTRVTFRLPFIDAS